MSIENGIFKSTAPRRGAMSNKWQLALLYVILEHILKMGMVKWVLSLKFTELNTKFM